MAFSPKQQSVAKRITSLSIALVAVVLVLVGTAISGLTERNARAQVVRSVGDTTASVANALAASDATNRELVQLTMKGFQLYFDPNMTIHEESGELRSFGAAVKDDNGPVDRFAMETGGVAQVYSRKGDGFEIISTSVKGANDGRETGGELAGRPLAAALSGKPLIERVVIHGLPYMGYYLPVLGGPEKKTIAVLFIGNNIGVMERTQQKQVAQTRFFEHGGIYVIDPRNGLDNALFLAHPTAAGKRVLDVFPESRAFLDQLAGAADSVVQDVKSVLGNEQRPSWALVRQTAEDGVWVVAEVPDAEAMASQRPLLAAVWGLMALAVALLAAGLFLMLRRGVARPLAELTQAVTRVAQGDLTHSFDTTRRDEIGTLVNEVEGMRLRYQSVLQDVRSAIDNITIASAEIATGNHDLSVRTEQTAGSLQQTAQSMEQLTATVRQSADAARQANQLAGSAGEVAARGGVAVAQVVGTMGEINQSSRRIADIIGVIDGIAFQTNILALNAAVEAARAGEQGRGFAVVASEVRSLAGRSADAAKEIKALIEASVDKAETGARQVQSAGATMEEIVGSIARVGGIVSEITAAASEQSEGIGQVNTAVNELDQMTQQNAALVEQSAAAAQSLRDQAQRLAAAVQVFKLAATPAEGALQTRDAMQGKQHPAHKRLS